MPESSAKKLLILDRLKESWDVSPGRLIFGANLSWEWRSQAELTDQAELVRILSEFSRLGLIKFSSEGRSRTIRFPEDFDKQYKNYRRQWQARLKKEQTQHAAKTPLYWLTWENRSIYLNTEDAKYLVKKFQFNRPDEKLFEYVVAKPRKTITPSAVKEDLKFKPNFNKFVNTIGFKGEMRKAFFDASTGGLRFIPTLSAKDMGSRQVNRVKLDQAVAKLQKVE